MNSNTEYWIESAQYDIETAKAMLETKRYLYVGFMCHLTIEKALKAVISQEEIQPPKIHDLVKLAKQSKIYSLMNDGQKDFLEVLLPLNIEARYPSYKSGISASLDNSKCEMLANETEGLLCWIKQQL